MKSKKMNSKGTAMLLFEYTLDIPSGTYRFYNPQTDSIVVCNTVTWSDFKPWQAANVDSVAFRVKDQK